MMPLDRNEERYKHDNEFRAVVDMLQGVILRLQLTPGECRDAAMFAAFLVEMRRPPPGFVRGPGGDVQFAVRYSATEVGPGTPAMVAAWDKARGLVERWESDNAYGRDAVNLTPKNRDDLVRRIALALLPEETPR